MYRKTSIPPAYNKAFNKNSVEFQKIFKKIITLIFIPKGKQMRKTRSKVIYTSLRENEVMKEIEGYPLCYITNQGRVLSTKPLGSSKTQSDLREVVLSFGNQRYYYANIYNENNIRVSIRVHRLVYQYFNGIGDTLKEGFVVDHIDHDKLNNHSWNLRQITQSENQLHYHRNKKK